MDFIIVLLMSSCCHDAIMVMVDTLTKVSHFSPVQTSFIALVVVEMLLRDIVRLHGIPCKIILDRDSLFTSSFWRQLQVALGTRLDFSTAYHPQANGQIERVNQILEDMLQMYVKDHQVKWEEYLHLAKFSYNNGHHYSIGVPPY